MSRRSSRCAWGYDATLTGSGARVLRVLLTPLENAADARPAAQRITIIEISRVADALAVLQRISSAADLRVLPETRAPGK